MSSEATTPPPGTVDALAQALRDRTTTAEALCRGALDRITAFDEGVHAFVMVAEQEAMAAARQADAERARGVDRGPLHGIPYALKDIYDAEGWPTTCQSRLRLDHVARRDSAVAERFRAAGAILLGKLDTFEFALGGPSSDLHRPLARNPWDTTRVAGGSSSGSGAAIAAGYVPLAPGTCTTGSIRGPSAWCGAVGLKPTFGRVSRRGVFPLAPSLDHCGPIARSVRDVAHGLQVMAGYDPEDPSSADRAVPDYLAAIEHGVAGLRIGVPRAFFAKDPALSDEMRAAIERVERLLAEAGAHVFDVTLPDYGLFLACGRALMTAEAFAIHRHNLQTRLSEYGAVAARRFAIGATVSAADYMDTLLVKRHLAGAVDAAFGRCDLMLTAISLRTAPPFDDSGAPIAFPLQASPFNVTGHPAISVPAGLSEQGLPLAVQFVGSAFDEATVLRAARFVERATGWLEIPLPTLASA